MMTSNGFYTYDQLKNILKNENLNMENMNKIKEIFKTRIDSNRRLSSIHTIEDLIDTLERRDILSYENIEAFKEISLYCTNPLFRDGLRKFVMNQTFSPTENQYREIRLREELETKLRISNNTQQFNSLNGNHFSTINSGSMQRSQNSASIRNPASSSLLASLPDNKKDAIFRKLSTELGKYWRSFGRELGISEGQMDDIEDSHRDISTRVYKLLDKFQNDPVNDPRQHIRIICNALDNCKRKDLRRYIEDILSY